MANTSPLYGLMLAKQTQHRADITAETITGIETSAVLVLEEPRTVQSLIDTPPIPPPAIIICPAQQAEEIKPFGQAGGRAVDEIGYPVLVVMFAIQDSENLDNAIDWRLNLRDRIMDRHREQATTITDPAATFHKSKVVPGPQLNHGLLNHRSIWVSSFTATHYTLRQVPA